MRITTDYRIILPHGVSEAFNYAAAELKKYFAMIDPECVLEVRTGALDTTRAIILETAELKDDSCRSDRFRIFVRDACLHIQGQTDRAVIYAAYRLLEELGCRFFSPDTEKVPRLERIELDDGLDIFEGSPFEYRDIYWSCAFDTEWSLKARLNGTCKNPRGMGRNLPESVGGGLNYAGPYFVHSFSKLIPPDEYFDTHPEYFSEIDGVRTAKHLYSQLCMTNEEVISIAAAKACEWLKASPDCKMVSISQNDSFVMNSYCQCEECKKIIEYEGAPSGALIHFVNKVAERIEKEFPDAIVDTIAYQYSVKPPKYIRPRENVCVRICTGGCNSHPIDTCEQNLHIREAFESWSSVSKKLYVWDYTTNFGQYLTPYPNFTAIPQNVRFFKDHNVRGLFMQGQYQEGKNGEFGELRSYLISRLLWDPDTDVERDAREFIGEYYGNAAQNVFEYLKFIHEKGEKVHMGCAFTCKEKWDGLIDDSELAYLDKLWSDAIAVCNDEKTRIHSVRSSMCHEWFRLDSKRGEYSDSEKYESLREEFYEKVRTLDIHRLSEGAGIPNPQLT